jgi:uncharacterized protein (TIGR04222 family)
MNPFELRGPEFLTLYLALSFFVILAVWFHRRRAESGPAPKLELHDPYLIAYLRGGENEALRLGVVTLVDRGLLKVRDTELVRAEFATEADARNPLELELLKKFRTNEAAASVFKDAGLKSACNPYKLKLQQAGLLPDSDVQSDRWQRFGLAALVLGGLALGKIVIGVSRDRPVVLLVILAAVSLVALAVASFPRLTARGRAMMADIKTMYAGLRDRGTQLRRGNATPEMMMCVAIFGIAALTPTEYAFARTLFPQASSSSCGSSCGASGSSCGSGGGCGGGGCGGCGS